MKDLEPYILTPRLFKALKKRLAERFCCRKCKDDKPLEIGDEVISKTIRGGRKVIYHKKCYDETFQG